MLKFAEKLPRLAYSDNLTRKPLDLIKKKVYTNNIFHKNSYSWCRLPCVTLSVVDLNKCNIDKHHEYNLYLENYIRNPDTVPIWTRAFWGKRAWKSVLINTHRDPIFTIMSLFAKPDHFYDLKVNYSSYMIDKTHFSA